MLLTTYEGVRNGGTKPEFNSLSYHGAVNEAGTEWGVKIFSDHKLSDAWLNNVFNGKIGWVLRKEVCFWVHHAMRSVLTGLHSGMHTLYYLPERVTAQLFLTKDYITSMHLNRA